MCDILIWQADTHTFSVVDWAGLRFSEFCRYAIEHYGDDGLGSVDDDGTPRVTHEQKMRIARRGVADIFRLLEGILQEHASGVIDYATWYCASHAHRDTGDSYGEFISRITCARVVESGSFSPFTRRHAITLAQ